MRRLAAALLLLGLPLSQQLGLPLSRQAAAQERPLALPDRDVDVTYRINVGPQPYDQRSRFLAGAQRMRVDMPTPGVYTIMDYRSHQMSFVVTADRAALDIAMPPPPNPPYGRLGADQVAGQACTEWQTIDTAKQPAVACITDGGVLLRVRRGATPIVVATTVGFTPLDPALFSVPAGFQHVSGPARR